MSGPGRLGLDSGDGHGPQHRDREAFGRRRNGGFSAGRRQRLGGELDAARLDRDRLHVRQCQQQECNHGRQEQQIPVELRVQPPLQERRGEPGGGNDQQRSASGPSAPARLRAEPVVRPAAEAGRRVEPIELTLRAVEASVPRPHQAANGRRTLAQRIKGKRAVEEQRAIVFELSRERVEELQGRGWIAEAKLCRRHAASEVGAALVLGRHHPPARPGSA